MSAGPQQYIEVNGVQVSTSEFVKNREAILGRLNKEKKSEPGQMMNVAQAKFDKELEKAKEIIEDSIENEVETPVPTVSETTTLPLENVDVDNVPVEDENESEKVKIPKRKIVFKKK